MATVSAPVDDRELDLTDKHKAPKRKAEPPVSVNGVSTPNRADGVAAAEPSTEPAMTPELPAKPTRPEPPNPFSPATLRLEADYSEGLGVRKVISTIPNRKPNKSEWFQVRPGDAWRLQTAVLELERGVERSTYLVARPLWADLSGEITPALLLTCLNRANDLFLWRIKLPGPDGRSNTWTDSALQIAKAAETTWCRMVSDTTNGIYTHYVPAATLPEPKWPELTFDQILQIAFRDRLIDSLDHPVIRELRGGI